MPRKTAFVLLCFLAWGVAGYAIVVYALLPFGAALDPAMRPAFELRRELVLLHAFSASLALLLGPTQWLPGLRARRPALHRWLGRGYLAGVAVGGTSGLALAAHAFGGPFARLGFAAMAVAWLATAVCALAAILQGDVAAHRRWVLRNFAVTLAAVTLRLYMPLGILVAGLPLVTTYAAVAWVSWVPNLVVVEWWLRWRAAGSGRGASTASSAAGRAAVGGTSAA